MTTRTFFVAGLIVAILVAVGLSQLASSQPDGLEYVAAQEGFIDTAQDHDLADTPLAHYGEGLSDNGTFNTAVAGLIGVVVTLGLGYGLFRLVRRREDTAATQR